MVNERARRFLLLQQQLRILRRQQAVASAPGYFEHMAATVRVRRPKMGEMLPGHVLRLMLVRGWCMDPYNTADQL